MTLPLNASSNEMIAWIQWYLEDGRTKGGAGLARSRAWSLYGWMGEVADFLLEGMGCALRPC
ncbi:MAG: hypothetical protein L6R48_15290, partial [Planctomycetes bacterium]|nr:hypothetical protein [Planctomycetota bacterium]